MYSAIGLNVEKLINSNIMDIVSLGTASCYMSLLL